MSLAIGINSNTLDNRHIFMCDFDINKFLFDKVFFELLAIQKKFRLSNIYILSTKNGFNCFSLDKLKIDTLSNILSELTFLDKNFLEMGIKKGYYTLTMHDTKEFYKCIQNKEFYIQSYAHYLFFTEYMNYPILKNNNFNRLNNNFDDSDFVSFSLYENKKYGVFDDLMRL